jgi:hypothetical protein
MDAALRQLAAWLTEQRAAGITYSVHVPRIGYGMPGVRAFICIYIPMYQACNGTRLSDSYDGTCARLRAHTFMSTIIVSDNRRHKTRVIQTMSRHVRNG